MRISLHSGTPKEADLSRAIKVTFFFVYGTRISALINVFFTFFFEREYTPQWSHINFIRGGRLEGPNVSSEIKHNLFNWDLECTRFSQINQSMSFMHQNLLSIWKGHSGVGILENQ